MVTIDMNRIREALPKRAQVFLRKKQTSKGAICYIECIVRWPGLYSKGTNEEEKTVEQVFQWQREIIGSENISEFYTEETGSHWFVYLKRVPMEFINTTDEDLKTYSGVDIAKIKKATL
jgi:hypothetical protein